VYKQSNQQSVVLLIIGVEGNQFVLRIWKFKYILKPGWKQVEAKTKAGWARFITILYVNTFENPDRR